MLWFVFEPQDTKRFFFLHAEEAQTGEEGWLIQPLISLARHRHERIARIEVIDPWTEVSSEQPEGEVLLIAQNEVLDPWSSRRRWQSNHIRIAQPEVVDPWREQSPPVIDRIDSPEIVDPWHNERGESLSRPVPLPGV